LALVGNRGRVTADLPGVGSGGTVRSDCGSSEEILLGDTRVDNQNNSTIGTK
jgi:hypothetical protein